MFGLLAQGNELVQNLRRCCGDWRAAFAVAEGKEIAAVGVGDGDADFAADERGAGVVPDAVLLAIEVAVETAVGDETEIESSGTVGAELPPPRMRGRRAGNSDDALVERS